MLYLEKKLQWCQMHIFCWRQSDQPCINPNHIDASATGDDGTKVPSLFKLLGGLPKDARLPVVKNLKVKYVRLANNLVDAATAKIKFQEGCHPLLKSGNFWKKPRIKGRSGGWCFQSYCCCKTFLTIHRRCYVCLLMKILGSRLQAKSSVVTNGNLLKIVPFLS